MMNNSNENKKQKRPFVDMYADSKLSFKSKKFWVLIILPPILLVAYKMFFIIGINLIFKNISYLLKVYIAGCFCMFVILCLIDGTQMTIKDLRKRNLTGKIVLVIIFVVFIIKALWEIYHAKR